MGVESFIYWTHNHPITFCRYVWEFDDEKSGEVSADVIAYINPNLARSYKYDDRQRVVTLSTTEAELYAAVQCAQEMLFVKHIMESIGLNVKLPMKLFSDNKGAILLTNKHHTATSFSSALRNISPRTHEHSSRNITPRADDGISFLAFFRNGTLMHPLQEKG